MMDGNRVPTADSALNSHFNAACSPSPGQGRRRKRPPPPFSIRFTEEERARLASEAGKRPLAAHIRSKLFGDAVSQRRRRPARRTPPPKVDQIALGRALGELGHSRLASNMNQIAKAANMGALPVTPELEQELHEACVAICDMRRQLVAALGIKPEGGR